MLVGYFTLVQDVLRYPAKRDVLGTEARFLVIVGLAALFVFVRLLYSALGDFTGAELWISISDNDTIYLIMDVLIEIIAITIMYTTVYFAPLPKEAPAERIADAEGVTAKERGSESPPSRKRTARETKLKWLRLWLARVYILCQLISRLSS